MGVEMPQFVARFLLPLVAAFLPFVGYAHDGMRPSGIAEWGLLLADVLLGVVAILLVVAGAISYSILTSGAKEEAQKTAKEEVRKFLEEGETKRRILDLARKESDDLKKPQKNETGEEK